MGGGLLPLKHRSLAAASHTAHFRILLLVVRFYLVITIDRGPILTGVRFTLRVGCTRFLTKKSYTIYILTFLSYLFLYLFLTIVTSVCQINWLEGSHVIYSYFSIISCFAGLNCPILASTKIGIWTENTEMDRKKRLDLAKVYGWLGVCFNRACLYFSWSFESVFHCNKSWGQFPHGFLKNYLVEW